MRQVGQLPRIIAWCTVNKTLKNYKKVNWESFKVPVISCPILIKLGFSRQMIEELFKYQVSWKSVRWEPSCSKRTDRRTHQEDDSRLSQFWERVSKLFELPYKLFACYMLCPTFTVTSLSNFQGICNVFTAQNPTAPPQACVMEATERENKQTNSLSSTNLCVCVCVFCHSHTET